MQFLQNQIFPTTYCTHPERGIERQIQQLYFCVTETCKNKGQWFCDVCVTGLDLHNHLIVPKEVLQDYMKQIIENPFEDCANNMIFQNLALLIVTIEKFKLSLNEILDNMIKQAKEIQQSENPRRQIILSFEQFSRNPSNEQSREKLDKVVSKFLKVKSPSLHSRQTIGIVQDASYLGIKSEDKYVQLFLISELLQRFETIKKIIESQDLFKFSLHKIIPRYTEIENQDTITIIPKMTHHLALRGKQQILLKGFFIPAPIKQNLDQIKYNLKVFMNSKLQEEQKQISLLTYERINKQDNLQFIYIQLKNRIIFGKYDLVELKQEFSTEFKIPKVYSIQDNNFFDILTENFSKPLDVFTSEFVIQEEEKIDGQNQ